METAPAGAYVGRRRKAPRCQFGLEGCAVDGAEIAIPTSELVDVMSDIGVACPDCESKLWRD